MSEKIVLIDGHSILNRAFYGIPPLTNSRGVHTNAVYGFLNIMFKILEEEKPQYLAVAFDLKAPTFRHQMYDAYKGNRSPMPPELSEQVPLMKQMLTAMGIPLMMLEGYEADDLIGTVSRQAQEAGLFTSVISGDRDLLQLSSPQVMIRIPKTKRTGTEIEDYLPEQVLERYQVTPEQIVDLKALMGDSSDNIPGIPGVGEKTAAKIIAAYGTIENAYAHVEEITPNKAKTSLSEHYELAQLSKKLAAIDRNAPFTLDLEQARINDLYTQDALLLCRELEFKNLLARFAAGDGTGDEKPPFRILTDKKDIDVFLERAGSSPCIGLFYLEEDGALYGVSVSVPADDNREEETSFIPLKNTDSAGQFCERLRNLCRNRTTCLINLKNQLQYLEGVNRERFFDAAIGAYLLNPLAGSYSYDVIAREYAGRNYPAGEELIGKARISDLISADVSKAAYYACYQAASALASQKTISEKLEETGMYFLFARIEMPLVFVLYDMQKEGITVRADALASYGEILTGQIEELEEKIYEEAGERFNINSPKQLGVILFEKLGLSGGKKTKSGYSTAADVLEKLAQDAPVVRDILSYRQLAKLKSTYADALSSYIAPDGRIHGTFHQTVTATGRLSSADPNLQNIPVRTELGRQLRKVFVPKEGCLFTDADYSQIELRVLAHMSGDEKLIEAYRQARDIHASTASEVFHVPLGEVTPLQRRNAKAVNFGIVYGISSFGLSQDLSITRKEAQEYIETYFRTYPGIKQFLDQCVSDAKEKGYAVTLFGRRRPVPELSSGNFMQRSFGERVAMNSPIQGTAADIIKIAMIRVHDRLLSEQLSSRLILQVHDELLVETCPGEEEAVARILREEMMGAADLKVSLEIDLHTGSSWYEAK